MILENNKKTQSFFSFLHIQHHLFIQQTLNTSHVSGTWRGSEDKIVSKTTCFLTSRSLSSILIFWADKDLPRLRSPFASPSSFFFIPTSCCRHTTFHHILIMWPSYSCWKTTCTFLCLLITVWKTFTNQLQYHCFFEAFPDFPCPPL